MADEIQSAPPGVPNFPPGAIATQPPLNLPPIPLDGPAKPMPAAPPITPKKDTEIKDSFRELIETIVFVVVLVLMLKTFLAEAFVIPTGSMANTLLGYHYKITCSQCGYPNLVNASAEAEPANPKRPPQIVRCQCINCKHMNKIEHPEVVRGGQQ